MAETKITLPELLRIGDFKGETFTHQFTRKQDGREVRFKDVLFFEDFKQFDEKNKPIVDLTNQFKPTNNVERYLDRLVKSFSFEENGELTVILEWE